MADHTYRRVLVNAAYLLLVYYWLVSCNPAILFGGVGKVLAFALFAAMLLFVVEYAPEISRVAVCLLQKLCLRLFSLIVAPNPVVRPLAATRIPNKPALALLFRRPPPNPCL